MASPATDPPPSSALPSNNPYSTAFVFPSQLPTPVPTTSNRPPLASPSSWDFDALFSAMSTFPPVLPDLPAGPLLPSSAPPPPPTTTPLPVPQSTTRPRPTYLDLSSFPPTIPTTSFESIYPFDPSRPLATAAEVLSCGAARPGSSESTDSTPEHTSWQLVSSHTMGWSAFPGMNDTSQDVILPLGQSTLMPANLMLAPLHQPDALACYFITSEQRQQVGVGRTAWSGKTHTSIVTSSPRPSIPSWSFPPRQQPIHGCAGYPPWPLGPHLDRMRRTMLFVTPSCLSHRLISVFGYITPWPTVTRTLCTPQAWTSETRPCAYCECARRRVGVRTTARISCSARYWLSPFAM